MTARCRTVLIRMAVIALGAAPVLAESFHGRGVYFADAATPCAVVGVGTRGAHACLRIALDDDHSSVSIDRSSHRIVFRNSESYAKEQIVGDILLPGWMTSLDARLPVRVHAVLRKKGSVFTTKVYAHVVTHQKAENVEIEDLEVVLSDGKTETVAVTREAARQAVLDPGLAARLSGFLVEVTDNLAATPSKRTDVLKLHRRRQKGSSGAEPSDESEGSAQGDVTISLGLGIAAKKVVRAQLFRSGSDLELRFTSLSPFVPAWIVKRDLFLYGVEGLPALAKVKERGLKSGETIVIASHGGKGSVSLGTTTSDVPAADAENMVRDFLETAFIGELVAHQAHLDTAH